MDNQVANVIKEAKEKNQVRMEIEKSCDEYLQLKADIKEKNAQLSDLRENDVQWIEYKDLQKKIKELRAAIQGKQDFIDLKEEIAELKDKRLAAESIIVSLLREKNIRSYDYEHADFQIEDKFKFKKRKDDDENSKKYAEFTKDFDKSDM